MIRYPALIDGEAGAYGICFPDIDGVVAMGETIDAAILNAEEALRDYAIDIKRDGQELATPTPMEKVEVPAGSTLTSIPLIITSGKAVRANMLLDEGVVSFIDNEAKRRGMTRTAYVSYMTQRMAQMGG
ncbi:MULTISPECIES: type II toxin-antitoxin system HicB family antitoxin [Rhizobium/Agrobacterium group]|uniref:type II toxin-antitoxin system HicB family antitoxin n=1 Tax=Rhizobium/Agrobacterium group TaxID=227290 RepID=UPI000B406566|nr:MULTISPECIES: type II toxin-antitoxin system HicB family antitoxin [Rhizobium/Agrobacterium group]MCF1485566.1 hypothetical protein [Allorhizobium ampelinum]NSZ46256.1 hypothetical protein [Agrobacterium vitis]NTA25353.1 hypothetical protein [Allorhizobium ampelinum]OVE97144.1 hypothetical protein B7W85_02430 [Allorhizobium ampelinum]